ncbi:MAG: hypothetical protein AB8F34_02820, partial [Akkermansiaceae bacterium]
QISVVGSEQQVRGGIASMARSLLSELNTLCNEKQRQMKLPLVIRLYGAQGDAEEARSVVSDITQLQAQYQLNIRIHLARGVDWKKLRYYVMEMLLYERGLRDGQEVEQGERVLVKPWLIVGMLETIDHRAGRGDRRLYQSKIQFLDILSVQQVFDTSEKQWRAFDGRKPIAFRAISGAMVSSLVRQPKGRPSLSAYLADFATFKGESENLMRKHFPAMNTSRNSLEKWVSLEMLELGTSRLSEVYSILETEKRLDSILQLRYRDKEEDLAKTVSIEDFDKVLSLQDVKMRVEAVAGARSELERLSYRCFPTYRPVIAKYQLVLQDIIKGKGKKIPVKLEENSDYRINSRKAAERVRDYLDWYYITQSNEVGGSFIQYRELSKALEKENSQADKNDSTEIYLDHVQRIYGGSPTK